MSYNCVAAAVAVVMTPYRISKGEQMSNFDIYKKLKEIIAWHSEQHAYYIGNDNNYVNTRIADDVKKLIKSIEDQAISEKVKEMLK